jgi:hypothetical protein
LTCALFADALVVQDHEWQQADKTANWIIVPPSSSCVTVSTCVFRMIMYAYLLVFSDLHGNDQLSLIEPSAFDKLASLEDLCVSGY